MRTARTHKTVLAVCIALGFGCGGDRNGAEPKPDAPTADSGVSDAAPDATGDTEPDCTQAPDHSAIINAATSGEAIDKQPVLPLLKSDGTLPPLP